MICLLVPILVPFLWFPSVYIIEKFGLRVGLIQGVILQCCGYWLQQFMTHSFKLVIAGQVFIAIGMPFIQNTPSKLSALWFYQKHRLFASVLGSVAPFLGFIASIKISNALVIFQPLPLNDYFNITARQKDMQTVSTELDLYLLVIAVIETLVLLIVLIGFREVEGKRKGVYLLKAQSRVDSDDIIMQHQ